MNNKFTLPTPPAIRGELEEAKWELEAEAAFSELWIKCHGTERVRSHVVVYGDGQVIGELCHIDDAVEFAVLVGIVPPSGFTKAERKAVTWAMELMGDCAGRDTLHNFVSRFTGETAPGYRLVPEDVAEKALPYIKALIAKSRQLGWTLNDCDAEAEKMKRLEAWANLSASLSRKEPESHG